MTKKRGLRGAVAHDVTTSLRTDDVILSDSTTFSDMLLNEKTLSGLHTAGFRRPSPIQRSAIPIGRCGTDLIVQAKSGTGKTLVFGIIALEMIDVTVNYVQVLILAPTREIAVQIKEVLSSIGTSFEGLKVSSFIGGMSVKDDVTAAEGCHIAVGTPGRVKQLIMNGTLKLRTVRLFVLDEADRMVDQTFRNDVNFIFSKLPENKQCLAVSATFPTDLEAFLTKYLIHPRRICPSGDTLLLGLRQFVAVTRYHTSPMVRMRNKTEKLLQILTTLSFRQCLVFCNVQSRMENICRDLASKGWPSLHLSGSMPQPERLATVAALQNQQCRVLLTTDLAARGVDAEQVDLVINLDLPYDTETYLHRIGRAGRFGASGVAVSIMEDGEEYEKLRHTFFDIGGQSLKIPRLPDTNLTNEIWTNTDELERIAGCPRPVEESAESEAIPLATDEAINIVKSAFLKLNVSKSELSFLDIQEMSKNWTKTLSEVTAEQDQSRSENEDVSKLEAALETLGINEMFSEQKSRVDSEYKLEESNRIHDNDNEDEGSDVEDEESDLEGLESDIEEEESDIEEVVESDIEEEESDGEGVESDLEEEEGDSDLESSVEDMRKNKDCSICSGWFGAWRSNLSMQRHLLQKQLYLQEMLK